MVSKLKDLEVYKLSVEAGNIIWDIVQNWNDLQRRTAGDQMIKAVDAIGANIAKAYGRQSFRDDKRFREAKRYCYIAGGELEEAIHWIRLASMRGFFKPDELEKISPMIKTLPEKLSDYIKGFGSS
ncbi:MAG: four helix bundle protein [candidate division Zixibacteria bacterium]|nr:four helix bundle protein [Candidatus Tariuqbacter arcticus]